MDDQRNDHIDPERHLKKETHKLPTDIVEHINSTNKEGDFLLANKPRIVPWGTGGWPKWSGGTGELLYIDQHILNENKTRRKNQTMALIDYKKAYNMVPQSWIMNCLRMYKISDEVINFIEKTWKVELIAKGSLS